MIAPLDDGPPACVFCRQAVDGPAARACPRCRAPYHPDCWAANSGRCGVYGCEPAVAPPPPTRPAEPPPFDPLPAAPREGRSWAGAVGVIMVLAVTQGIRLLPSGPSSAPPPPPRLDVVAPQVGGPRSAVGEVDVLMVSARSVLAEMTRARQERAELEKRLDLLRRGRAVHDGLLRVEENVQDDLRRLQIRGMLGRLRQEMEALSGGGSASGRVR